MLPIQISKPHENLIIEHLLHLDLGSKMMRFGYNISNENIRSYVEKNIDTPNNVWYCFLDEGKCVGAAHIAIINDDCAELGISLNKEYRGQKLSNLLFDRAIKHLKSIQISHITIQCLSENAVIQHLAKKYGLKVKSLGPGEKEASGDIDVSDPISAKIQNATEDIFSIIDVFGRNTFWAQKSISKIINNFYRKALHDRTNKTHDWRRNSFRYRNPRS